VVYGVWWCMDVWHLAGAVAAASFGKGTGPLTELASASARYCTPPYTT
jgi:hypothetical protein